MSRLFAAELLKLTTLRFTWGIWLVGLLFAGLVTAGQHRWHERRRSARSGVPVPDPAGRGRPRLDPRAAHGDHPRDERVPSRDDRPVAARDAATRPLRGSQAPRGGGGGCGSDARNARRDRRDGGHLAGSSSTCPSHSAEGRGRLRPRASRRHAGGDSGAAIGGAVHSQVAALVGALVWMFVLEPICWVILGLLDLDGVAEYLPAASLGGAVDSDGDGLAWARSVGVTLGLGRAGGRARGRAHAQAGHHLDRRYAGWPWLRPFGKERSSSSGSTRSPSAGAASGASRRIRRLRAGRRAGRHRPRARHEGEARLRRGSRHGARRVPSDSRVAAPCRHFGVCGGCRFQDLAYSAQLAEKERQVRDALVRIGRFRRAAARADRARRVAVRVPQQARVLVHVGRRRRRSRLPSRRPLGRGHRDRGVPPDDRSRQRDPARRSRLGPRGAARGLRPGGRVGVSPPSRRARGAEHGPGARRLS